MKSTGIVRPVDALGRIVIPIELRRSLDINTDDSLEVFVQDDYIMLKKFEARCVFCGSDEDVQEVHGKNVCGACIKELKRL